MNTLRTYIDNMLNNITMYKLVLYVLIGLVAVTVLLGIVGLTPYNPIAIIFSVLFFTALCLAGNALFAWAFSVPANTESVYITALILALIISPPRSPSDSFYFPLAIVASVVAMASKYIFAIKRKHVFNPAALAVVVTGFTLGLPASWWVGTKWTLPFVIVGGLLITRKIRRFDLVLAFGVVAAVTMAAATLSSPFAIVYNWGVAIVDSPIIFFATVMLTEPLTTPPTRWLRIIYGGVVGFLFAPAIHIGSLYTSPELALVAGNVFSYLVSPKDRLILELKKIQKVANDTYHFVFNTPKPLAFVPGQYLEWTLTPKGADSRGNRRYFTIASSPTERELMMGVKFYPKPSSFKKQLATMRPRDTIIASQRAGDFVLPHNKRKKLVFIAGGIGITPFRSMLKFLIDRDETRDIVVLYSNKTIADVAYTDVLETARENLGVRTVYTLTDEASIPSTWRGRRGFIDRTTIVEEVPDFTERMFYISGPQTMVDHFDEVLRDLGVPRRHIKKDFFPGFA